MWRDSTCHVLVRSSVPVQTCPHVPVAERKIACRVNVPQWACFLLVCWLFAGCVLACAGCVRAVCGLFAGKAPASVHACCAPRSSPPAPPSPP